MPLVSLKDISFSYAGTRDSVLSGISLEIGRGEYVAVLGANGSGKSTLARILAGLAKPDSGEVRVEKGARAGIVFQQPKEQVVAGIVERDTAFGPQNLRLPKNEVELRSIECLASVDLLHKANSRTFSLSLGQTQKLALAGILALAPDIFILDEATSMLDPESRAEVMQILGRLNDGRRAIIHVTHDEEEARLAGRVLVLKGGKLAFDGSQAEFARNSALSDSIFKFPLGNFQGGQAEGRKEVFSAEGIGISRGGSRVLDEVSISLREGEFCALTGASGSGKTTFMEIAAGLLRQDSGRIRSSCRPALAQQESEAALFERIAADDVAFGPLNQGVSGERLLSRVKDAMQSVSLPFEQFGERPTFALSGGEKRKLALAGILAMDSQILMFDEPTAGLDPQSRRDVLLALQGLCREGKTVLFSTHRMEEAEFAGRHIHLQDGRILIDTSDTGRAAPQKAESAPLEEFSAFSGTKMIEALGRAGGAFFAPAKIPHSPVAALCPLFKYLLFLGIFTFALIQNSPAQGAAATGLALLYALLSRFPLKTALRRFFCLTPWILLLAVLQFLCFRMGAREAGIYAVLLCARCFCAVTALGVFMATTDERALLDGLAALLFPLEVLRLPTRYAVLVAGIVFRFVPLLLEEAALIIKTQLVRGALGNAKGIFAKFRLMIPLFVPLMIRTLKKAESLADALDARYFS